MIWIITGILVFLFSTLLTGRLAIVFKKSGIVDVPNGRSSHITPTPRGGGLAMVIGILFGLALLVLGGKYAGAAIDSPGLFFWTGFLLIAAASFIDDKLSLPTYVRFGLHFIAANLVFYETGGLSLFPLPAPFNYELQPVLNYVLTVVWIIGVLNIYNFLDGIDGFAAAQAIVAGIAMAVIDFSGAGFTVGILTVSAASGFLVHNWRPAKIFMGDIGSAALGFIFAAAPLYFTQMEKNVAIFSMGIFLWFFLSDGAFTILRRLLKGEKIWQAHRSHLYQRLVIAGLPHDRVALAVMSAAALLSVSLLALYFLQPDLLIWILVLAAINYLGYYYFVRSVVHHRRHR